jgi:putative MFS transporter
MLLPAGLSLASFLGVLLLPNWRLLYFIGAVPAVLSLIGRLFMPETPRSLYVRRKFGEAAKSIAYLLRVKDPSWISNVEKELADFYEKNPPKFERWYSQFVILVRKWREFISVVTLTGFAVGFVWYIVIPYIPLFLKLNYHMTATAAAAIYGTLTLTMIATRFTSATLTDIIGRKPAIFLALAIITVGAFAMVPLLGSAALWWALIPIAYGVDMSWAPTFVYANELYPTRSRSTASGTTYTIARIASIISPIILGIYLGTPASLQHAWPSFAIAGILAIIAILALLLLRLPETKGRGLKA